MVFEIIRFRKINFSIALNNKLKVKMLGYSKLIVRKCQSTHKTKMKSFRFYLLQKVLKGRIVHCRNQLFVFLFKIIFFIDPLKYMLFF